MANFGLSKPWIAKYVSNKKYTDAFQCGKAISTSVTPNTVNASLYADNQQVEDVTEFSNATIALGVNTLPAKAAPILFGHTVADDGTETSNTGDSSSYVGYGFVVAAMDEGVKKYQGCVLHKAKFSEGEESYQTKGDQITFVTPSLNGTAYGDDDGDWRTKSELFSTEAEADSWIQTFLGVTSSSSSTAG